MAMISSGRAYGASVPAPRPASLIARVFSLLGLYSSRQSLARLDDAMLDDIGITRAQAQRESRRSMWDVPSNWRL